MCTFTYLYIRDLTSIYRTLIWHILHLIIRLKKNSINYQDVILPAAVGTKIK